MRPGAGWRLWVAWVAASSLGFALGEFAGSLVGGALKVGGFGFLGRMTSNQDIIGGLIQYMIGGLMIGGFAAIMQWFVLRRWIALRAVWWTLAGAAGGGASFLLGAIAFSYLAVWPCWPLCDFPIPVPHDFALVVAGVVGGATLGLIQWFLLRRGSKRAGLWILANSLGYGIAVPVFWDLWIGETLRYAAMGAVAGVVTGLALAFILRTPEQAIQT